MHLGMISFVIVFVTVFAPALCYFNPLGSSGVVKNEQNKIISSAVEDIRRMQIKNPFSSMLLRGQPILNTQPRLDQGNRLQKSFNWTSCGPSNQIMEIKNLTLKPSPLSLPGTLVFSFDIVFHDTIAASDKVSASLKIEYTTGSSWIKIPCIGSIGSCTYNDLCSQLSGISCPADLTKQGVPCKCPFQKGEYKLHPFSQEIDAEVLMNGNYRVTANLMSDSKGQIGCYKLAFSVE